MARDEEPDVTTLTPDTSTNEDMKPTVPDTTDTLATEAPADATTEATATPEVPAGPTEAEINEAVTAFEELAKAVTEKRDSATGVLPEADLSAVRLAYGVLPATSARTRVKKFVETNMQNALCVDLDAVKARAWLQLKQVIAATTQRETIGKTPVDATQAHVERVAAMYMAPNLAEVADGVAADWATQVQDKAKALTGELQTFKAYLVEKAGWDALPEDTRGDEPKAPDVSPIILNAFRIARGRQSAAPKAKSDKPGAPKTTTSTYVGPRRSVSTHIAAAFAGVPVGTFLKISEIAGHVSEEYGTDHPSSGAVTAALKSNKFAVPGVKPELDSGTQGARKIA